ncbi:hypothetical protein [Staphylococcus capitis]|uniref:hypothetical protein n=1 Tax=Staphylococcus capitis TaxID=29388 RepID=UPI001887EAC6|nr:hypothetical protein [Staphylococcus capitis]MBF2261376.1 hypothetical protein [Staphylococcus capitis]MBF2281723.1 hypothetical protein [Staphylococcus capitis]
MSDCVHHIRAVMNQDLTFIIIKSLRIDRYQSVRSHMFTNPFNVTVVTIFHTFPQHPLSHTDLMTGYE